MFISIYRQYLLGSNYNLYIDDYNSYIIMAIYGHVFKVH